MEFEAFGSFDEAMEKLGREMRAADARVQPWQAAIKPGDYFMHGTPYGFNIYGEVLKEDEPREQPLRFYRLCQAYSVACPEGEMGDVHVSVIERLLSEVEFREAKDRRWDP